MGGLKATGPERFHNDILRRPGVVTKLPLKIASNPIDVEV